MQKGSIVFMTNFEASVQQLLEEAATYGKLFEQHQDDARFDKLNLFGEKISKEEYMIGFAGHFSAGKSSMINALTGGDLLPSSPIPTSANIVKVKKTPDDYAIIHLLDGTATKYSNTYFSEAVKSFSKNGDEVSLVEIGHHGSSLPEGITVMDTPGVDSTDDRHRVSTESALHLADLVFYTMDYNHVQSELNFTFTKELMRYNPNVYLIVNQIDKHRESELPFEKFKNAVEESFAMWGVEPKGIFYTSLMELDHPHNDFPKVKAIVDGAMNDWQNRFIENGRQTLKKLKDEHIQFLNEKIEETKETYEEVVSEDEWHQKEQLEDELREMKKTVELVQDDRFTRSFDRARNELIQNAAITPFEMREALKLYLESLSSRFKVGFLFGAKKTQEEKIARKAKFEEMIMNLLHTQIDVHLKLLMKQTLKEANILTDERSLAIDDLQFTISLDTIEKNFQPSDTITGDTVLNYASQMKVNIQHEYKRLTESWKEEMAKVVAKTGSTTSGKLKEEIKIMEEKVTATMLVEQFSTQKENLEKMVQQPPIQLAKAREALIEKWGTEIEMEELTEFKEKNQEEVKEKVSVEEVSEQAVVFHNDEIDAKVARAFHVANVLEGVESFSSTAKYLAEKAERLENQSFTVALFGAFSAGKSSFSNALIGENILPVSPNPTTATINRIRPVEAGKGHDTADVVLKTLDRMTEDLVRSFEALNLTVSSLEEAYEKVPEAMEIQLTEERQQMHKAFISAFHQGYEDYAKKLGTTIHVARDEFVRYVAEEERSCFVESIDFFYDCELTRKGITLVDTPGADSINARHTDVAFDYIRNTDAILFVTYYNHAFARADQEFLIQLGRVKDAFELDKMFFIVNAIDLAKDDEEAEAVKDYVAGELQQFGIRHPRVHGLSSLEALEAKVAAKTNPEMDVFETSFYDFLSHDLKGMAVQGLSEETDKTTERLALLIERTEQNRLRKADRLVELDTLEKEITKRYENDFSHVFMENARNELTELIHYVHQRVFLRFNDFFRAAYNPAVFAKHSKDDSLRIALQELVNMVGFDLMQEMKVTNLRMVQYMTKQLNERQKIEARALKELDETISPIVYEQEESEMLTFGEPFVDASLYAKANRFYKNSKSFFERGDSEKTRDYLAEALKEDAASYLENEKSRLEDFQRAWIEEASHQLQTHLRTESLGQLASERTLLEEDEKLEEWKAVYAQIQMKELV